MAGAGTERGSLTAKSGLQSSTTGDLKDLATDLVRRRSQAERPPFWRLVCACDPRIPSANAGRRRPEPGGGHGLPGERRGLLRTPSWTRGGLTGEGSPRSTAGGHPHTLRSCGCADDFRAPLAATRPALGGCPPPARLAPGPCCWREAGAREPPETSGYSWLRLPIEGRKENLYFPVRSEGNPGKIRKKINNWLPGRGENWNIAVFNIF